MKEQTGILCTKRKGKIVEKTEKCDRIGIIREREQSRARVKICYIALVCGKEQFR